MKAVLVNIPKERIRQLDELVEKQEFPNRNDAIREAIRFFLNSEQYVERSKLRAISNLWHRWNNRELESFKALHCMRKIVLEEEKLKELQHG